MKLNPPVEVSQQKLSIDVSEIEPLLRAQAMDIQPWPEAYLPLSDGKILYIREAKREEADTMITYMKRIMDVRHDFYNVVGARVCAEILGWYTQRLKDPYLLVGLIDGLWVGLANGRLMNEKINISHHTLALTRGARIGAAMYYVKAYYAFEILGSEEFWSTPESYNGWLRYIVGMAQQCYSWPEHQHELGGGRVYYITRKQWQNSARQYLQQMLGHDLCFDVPEEIREANQTFRVPEELAV